MHTSVKCFAHVMIIGRDGLFQIAAGSPEVLVVELGAGKGLLGRVVHELSHRKVPGTLITEQTDLLHKNKLITTHQEDQLKVVDRVISDFYNKGYNSLRSYQSLDRKLNENEFKLRLIKHGF
jgi:ABC-type oligopeptide transport system ATPase subunit